VVADPAPDPGDARSGRFRLGNRPPLTGIRALGIGAVLVFHANFTVFPGAWQALGLFFTLSGFLITAMLLGEREKTGRVNLRHFYARRATRLLPPLAITVVALAVYAAIAPVTDAPHRVWGDILAATFYYADYRTALGHGSLFGYLSQTWSLSVEEQFYAIWALALALILAVGTRRRALAYAAAVAGIVASAADRLWIIERAHPFTQAVAVRVYYAFDSRADAIFLGCLLGLVATGGHLEDWGPTARRVLSVAALASVCVLIWIGFEVPLFTRAMVTGWLPLSEVLWAVVLVYFVVNPEGLGSRFVGLGLFVFVGDLSYTLYLVHWPVYVALYPKPFWPIELARLAIIFTIALASWFLVERPLMRWRRRALS
jgi:peptidoglycan/LPS O-acetylase OafA/YrhL